MSDNRCPSEAELSSFVDSGLPSERMLRVEEHLRTCVPCAREVGDLRELTGDIAAPFVDSGFDLIAHVDHVMKRIDAPAPARTTPRWPLWAGGTIAAAAALLLVLGGPRRDEQGEFTARGGTEESALSRDIGVQVYGMTPRPRALGSGSRVRADVALTAGLRNLGDEPAYLLLFAVDSKSTVHWLAPEFTVAGTDPAAVPIPPSTDERLLPSSASFDDLAPGPVRVIALITPHPTHVSGVESLAADQLGVDALTKRFPRAEIRQVLIYVETEAAR